MKAALFMLPLALAGCAQRGGFAFRNTEVALPEDATTLPDGPSVDAVVGNCLACHSPAMILTQPRLTRKEWEAAVVKMVKVYKAPIDQAEVPQIVDYLVATNARLTAPASEAAKTGP